MQLQRNEESIDSSIRRNDNSFNLILKMICHINKILKRVQHDKILNLTGSEGQNSNFVLKSSFQFQFL